MLKRKKALPRRSAPLRKTRPLKRVNKQRKAKNWTRAYHSVERVVWVCAQPCRVCFSTPSINAHVGPKGKGTSRKADYDQITSLCDYDHQRLHRGHLIVDRNTRHAWAADTHARWLASSPQQDDS